jgi:hypothetical protein
MNRAWTTGHFGFAKAFLGKREGLKSEVLYGIYTMVVRPTITYATTVWWPRIKFKTSRTKLEKLQRLAYLGKIGSVRTAPAATV